MGKIAILVTSCPLLSRAARHLAFKKSPRGNVPVKVIKSKIEIHFFNIGISLSKLS
jgi:hypothetical protein